MTENLARVDTSLMLMGRDNWISCKVSSDLTIDRAVWMQSLLRRLSENLSPKR